MVMKMYLKAQQIEGILVKVLGIMIFICILKAV